MGSIYEAKCLTTGKKYYGQTKRKVPEHRIYYHKQRAYKDNYNNNSKFYNAIRKYGWNDFVWRFLHYKNIHITQLDSVESFYIWYYDSKNNGLNSTDGGDDNPLNNPEIRNKHKASQAKKSTRKKKSDSAKKYYSNPNNAENHRQSMPRGKDHWTNRPEHRETVNLSIEKTKATKRKNKLARENRSGQTYLFKEE